MPKPKEAPKPDEETQVTPKGYRIPIPKRSDFLGALERVSKPAEAKPKQK